VFFQVSHFYHPFPLNPQALHELSAVVAFIILILQMEVLRMRWLSFAKALQCVHAVRVKVLVPSPTTLSSPSSCFGAEIRFPHTWKRNALFCLTVFWFRGFAWGLLLVFLLLLLVF